MLSEGEYRSMLLLGASRGRQRLLERELNNISASLFCFRFLQYVKARPRRKRRAIAPMTPPAMGPALCDEDEASEEARVWCGEARETPPVAEVDVAVTVMVTGCTVPGGGVVVEAEVEVGMELVEVELEVAPLLETDDEEDEVAEFADVEIDEVALASAGDCWTIKKSRMRGRPAMPLVISRVCWPSGRSCDLKNCWWNCSCPLLRWGWKRVGLSPSMLYEDMGAKKRSTSTGTLPNTVTLVPVNVRVALAPESTVEVSVLSNSLSEDDWLQPEE
jgi:hypothetical protein